MTKLNENVYDHTTGTYRSRIFLVDTDWLRDYLAKDGQTLEEFLDEYTSEESGEIYGASIAHGTLILEYFEDGGDSDEGYPFFQNYSGDEDVLDAYTEALEILLNRNGMQDASQPLEKFRKERDV